MARVGTRGAGLSKDIALSVKNKLTHLGANVSDDLARLSGKVEDAFAYADGAVSKNIGKHNARVYQSNGGNWDEVASGILGGSGVGVKQHQSLATMPAKPLPNMVMKSAKPLEKLANKLVRKLAKSLVKKQVSSWLSVVMK